MKERISGGRGEIFVRQIGAFPCRNSPEVKVYVVRRFALGVCYEREFPLVGYFQREFSVGIRLGRRDRLMILI